MVDDEDLVWYAAYDKDLDLAHFTQEFKILPIQSQVCLINGFQLCFDQALTDVAFVKPFRPDSPNT